MERNTQVSKETSALKDYQKRILLYKFILIYFFVHIMIYSSHNFRETMCKKVFNISSKDFSLIEMFSAIKILGSVGGTWIGQKIMRPLAVCCIAIIVFIATLTLLTQKIFLNNITNIFLGILHIVADSAILPTIDAECIALLDKNGISSKFSIVRMFSTIGHASIYLINYILQEYIFYNSDITNSILFSTLLFGTITLVITIVSALTLDRISSMKRRRKEEESTSIITYTSVFTVASILLCALGSGMSRSSLQSYLTEYLIKRNTEYGIPNTVMFVYFFRTMCELFVWSAVIWVGDKISLELLFPIAISLGATRSLLYTINIRNVFISAVLPYFAEMLKSVYSALFIYASVKLVFKYSPSNSKTFCQGLFTGMYSGIAPFISGILSYFIFSRYPSKILWSRRLLFFIVGCIGLTASTSAFFLVYLRIQRRRSPIVSI